MSRRVVVTGMGAVLPGTYDVNSAWNIVKSGKSFITKIDGFDISEYATKIAGEIKFVGHSNFTNKNNNNEFIYNNLFDPESCVEKKDIKKMDKFILYGLKAAQEAVTQANIASYENNERVGVMIGSGIGGIEKFFENNKILIENGPKKISPFFIPSVLINILSGYVSMKYGYKGPNFGIVSACATGTHSIGESARIIMADDADIMIVGGAEASVCNVGIAGFNALRALSTKYNDTPDKASRPWDIDRDGFVMGEGAGVLVLEEYEHAKKRGAKILCELVGYGASADAYHFTAPHPDGDGALLAMKNALSKAKIESSKIDYINAHGTSTPLGDEIEIKAIKRLLEDSISNVTVSSTKSSTGHLLGAAGAIEAIFSIMAIQDSIIPPTLNLDNPSEGCNIDLCPFVAKTKNIDYAMSNSFGFGGCNASLIFKKI